MTQPKAKESDQSERAEIMRWAGWLAVSGIILGLLAAAAMTWTLGLGANRAIALAFGSAFFSALILIAALVCLRIARKTGSGLG